MSVHRVMGIETEYGIYAPNDRRISPELLSAQVVNAYADLLYPSRTDLPKWNYYRETPFQDLREIQSLQYGLDGFPTEFVAPNIPNLMLPNGARLYVDHAHPEFSTPEVTNPLAATIWDVAGEHIMRRASELASQLSGNEIVLYKNNTDGKGASYGTHENYQVSRSVPFECFVNGLTPFFVTRNIWAGAGRVGIGQESQQPGFQISQRADFFEALVGVETTVNRPIINTRDEPHDDPTKFRRLHVIVGDANLSPHMTFLKMGATALVLAMIEDDALDLNFSLAEPVSQMYQVSRDLTLKTPVQLSNGTQLSALEIQRWYWQRAVAYVGSSQDEQTLSIMRLWDRVLSGLEADQESLYGLVDWITKKKLLDSVRQRDKTDWSDAKLSTIDLQYSDLRSNKSLYLLAFQSSYQEELFPQSIVQDAISQPPLDTRAFFRGTIMNRFSDQVVAASWESLILRMSDGRHARIHLEGAADFTVEKFGQVANSDLGLAEVLALLGSIVEIEQ